MSIDLELYTSRQLTLDDLRSSVPLGEAWREYGSDVLAYEATSWQVLVEHAEEIEPADVAPDLRALLPEARYRVSLTLEPIGAPAEGRAFLADVVQAVGGSFDCVGYDVETGAPRRYESTERSGNAPLPRRVSVRGGVTRARSRNEQADLDLADFLRTEADKLPALLREAGQDRVPTDFRIETLAEFLEWLSRRVTTVQEPVPAGVSPEIRASLERALRRLDARSQALVRTAGYYVGETFRATFPHLHWAAGEEGFHDEGKPVIAGFAHGLELGIENVTTNIVLAAAVDDDWRGIRTTVEAWTQHAIGGAAQ